MNIKEKISLVFGVPCEAFFDSFASKNVLVAELRPGLEGMQAVAQNFLKRGIEPVVICDNMLGFCMKRGLVKDVHIFYNGLEKKIALCRTGSLIAALCAKIHDIDVYLHPSAPLVEKASSLLKIDGMRVVFGNIKTYVPRLEEVPLEFVKIVKKEG